MAALGIYLRVVGGVAPGDRGYGHYCPGCRCAHIFWTMLDGKSRWAFDGNIEKPSFSPSMRSFLPAIPALNEPEVTLCHYILTAGVINFLPDSSDHSLRGNVPVPPFPADYKLD